MAEQRIRRREGGRSARVVKAVMGATVAVIADKGLADFTVTDVANKAGVHETSIYRRWGTRENLAVDALVGNSEDLIPVPDTGDLRSDLYALLDEIIEYLGTPRGRALNQALAFGGDESRWSTLRREFWGARLRRTRPIVDRAIARGEVAPTVDAELMLETLVAPMQFRMLVTRQPLDRDLSVRLTELVLDGVLMQSASNRPSNSKSVPHTATD